MSKPLDTSTLPDLDPAVIAADTSAPGPAGVTVRMHWLSFTTTLPLHELLGHVARLVFRRPPADGPGLFVAAGGARHYEVTLIGPHQVRVYHSPDREDKHVEIPGAACETCPPADLLEIFQLDGVKFTRIDLAIDGLRGEDGQPLCPELIEKMARDEPERLRTWANLSNPKSVGFTRNGNGETLYLGSRESMRYARIYNERGFTRLEVEFKGERAALVGATFDGANVDRLPALVVAHVRGFIDFVEPATNISRAKLQPWWAAVVEHVAAISAALEAKDATAVRTWKWLMHQVSGNLLTMLRAAGGSPQPVIQCLREARAAAGTDVTARNVLDTLLVLLVHGNTKIGPRHSRILATAGGEGQWTATS